MTKSCLFLIAGLTVQAVIVDAIVATVGRAPVTDSMVRRNLRAAALMAKMPLEETAAVWEENRNRLIEQALVKEEIRISRYPVAQPDEIRAATEQAKAQLGGAAAFPAKLRKYRLTEADVAENLAWQITFSRFIAFRFRPAVQVTEDALRAFYATWKPPGEKPAFEAARDAVEQDFIAEESARLLDRWLEAERRQTRIETLQPKSEQP